jgi:hypothetical protein
LAQRWLLERVSGVAGLQELRRNRIPLQLRRPASVANWGSPRRTPEHQPAERRARSHRHHRPVPLAGLSQVGLLRRFGPTKRSRKGYAAKLGYDWELQRRARKLDAIFGLLLRPDRHAPGAQNVSTNLLVSSRAKPSFITPMCSLARCG